ncbi:protein kinase [Aureimonas sp. ME7]|uniref:protein kinase domain-containing protein n=1 Tax=Aureimonas sp. ME7 TaxID=2744252 RepID=UPI0015F42B5A|nr:protein kinase [Aureimonas sp. ME7]
MSRNDGVASNFGFLEHPAYKYLRKAISEDVAPLVVVVGSGLSRSDGYPDWKGLRSEVETALRQKRIAELDADPKADVSTIENAIGQRDYWHFFRDAKESLTRPTYNHIISNILGNRSNAKGEGTESGLGLRQLLKLSPKGVVTLNLDPIAGNVFSEYNPGSMVIPIYGFDLNQKWKLISDEKRFLVYMHGHVSEPHTWVLGQDELDALTRSQAHSLFLTSLFVNHTVLFVGISADDLSISSPLISLKNSQIDVNRVFWFTSRTDADTKEWAKQCSVQLITYSAADGKTHASALNALVDDITGYKSSDQLKIAPKVDPSGAGTLLIDRIDPEELAVKKPEEVRTYLDRLVNHELSLVPETDKYSKFNQIVAEYDYPIQTRSFYRGPKEGNRQFFGYELTFPALGMGNFGTVYHARSDGGDEVAIKVMHNNILQIPEMVGGFRRGSRSMDILTAQKVSGIVPVKKSYEMPPTIVMNFVHGNSLQELFSVSSLIPWVRKIEIIAEVARVVYGCHNLEEIVLHRDLKPSNIMVSGLDYDTYEYESVTLLDFDMSWHKGSSEKDVVFESRDDFGYLAPEQTDASLVDTSRSTKVDSFGLGMTTLALLKSKHPISNMSLASDYAKSVYFATRQGYNLKWICLPNRLARLIVDATQHHQHDRIAFSSFYVRIEKIRSTISSASTVLEHDVFCEEILATLAEGRPYEWDDVEDKGHFILVGGVRIAVSVDEETLGARIDISYQDPGAKQYQRRNELIGQSRRALEKTCAAESFGLNRLNVYHGSFESSVLVEKTPTVENVGIVCRAMQTSVSYLRQIE